MMLRRLMTGLLLGIAVSAQAHAAWSGLVDDRYAKPRPVAATPFDKKLSNAGFFDERVYAGREEGSLDDFFKVAKSFRYETDRNGDHWQSAEETDAKKQGDCEDKAIWLYTRLRKAGYKNVCLTIGRYRAGKSEFHVWVTALDESGNIRLLDPSRQTRVWNVEDLPKNAYRPLFAFNGQDRYRL